jgi:hypothetical protein
VAAVALSLTIVSQSALAQEPAAIDDDGPAFPSTLAGSELEVLTYSGPEWLAEIDGDAPGSAQLVEGTTALLASLGKDIDDLTVRSALVEPSEGNQAVILAFQVDGAEARDFVVEAVGLLLGDVVAPQVLLRALGSRWVLRVADAEIPGVYPRTVYVSGDTAWIIGGDEAFVIELLEQLPQQSYLVSDDASPLAEQLPVVLGDRRRVGLYEAREPLFLPSLSGRLGDAFWDWMLDTYLASGVTPTDLVGVIAWWGLEATDESIEIEGYQVPGGSADAAERLRSQVLLADDRPRGGAGEPIEQTLGGRAVTTIDLGGGAQQHVFASGDTVWVVTDHAGERDMAEEAIAALP